MVSEVGTALERLSSALGQLETALERRLGEARRGDLETELQLMQDDRARLALELESASARIGKLDTAAGHIDRRIGTAIEAIERLLVGQDATARDGAT